MTANIIAIRQGKRIAQNRKEHNFRSATIGQVILEDGTTIKTVVEARFYQAKGSNTVRCCVWVTGHGVYGAGGGYAVGYGFHHESSALMSAFSDAGITLSQSIDGAGDYAIVTAITAIMTAIYPSAYQNIIGVQG